jgi:hypothetical protein
LNYLRAHLPSCDNHRFYFDHGNAGKDEEYGPLQKRVNEVFAEKGCSTERAFSYEFFPGADHSEAAWAARVKKPLRFLTSKT